MIPPDTKAPPDLLIAASGGALFIWGEDQTSTVPSKSVTASPVSHTWPSRA